MYGVIGYSDGVIRWEIFRPILSRTLSKEAKGPGGRPPYDCIFNDYGNIDVTDGFDETAQRRLAADFKNLSCSALMIVGKTPLTEELYGGYICGEYYKNYAVNIRNRFKNDKMHIIVKNY